MSPLRLPWFRSSSAPTLRRSIGQTKKRPGPFLLCLAFVPKQLPVLMVLLGGSVLLAVVYERTHSHSLSLYSSSAQLSPLLVLLPESITDNNHRADVTTAINKTTGQPQQQPSQAQQQAQAQQEEAISPIIHKPKQEPKHKHKQKDSTNESALRSLQQEPPSSTVSANHPVVHFVPPDDVTQQDSFAATWLMSRSDFLDMDLAQVGICEDAAFKAWNTRRHKLRMPLDYMDFAVEHLSKWWKVLEFFHHDVVYRSVTTKLQHYIQLATREEEDGIHNNNQILPVFHQTLATIAFQPYTAPPQYAKRHNNLLPAERALNLTVISLAATIESLRRAQLGRVLVVGSDDSHEDYARRAFEYLHDHLPHVSFQTWNMTTSSQQQYQQYQLGHLELGYVQITRQHYETKALKRNMPKGCLAGARQAFLLVNNTATRNEQEQFFMETWLGTRHDPRHWQYLYLTEPDSILITRTSALPQLKYEIDHNGGILAPFRLQPIPHESDLNGYPNPQLYLQASDPHFSQVLELDHTDDDDRHDVCCDEPYSRHHFRPGMNNFPPCGSKKWFMCGFYEQHTTNKADPHERLRPYQLVRLTKGTGLTTIAGNLFARRCFPARNATCTPRIKTKTKNKKKRPN